MKNRIKKVYCQEYSDLKREYVLTEWEKISDKFNPNIITYYSLDDIKEISDETGINSDDIILYFFGKSKKRLYNVKADYKKEQYIMYGEYTSIKIPDEYMDANYYLLKKVVVERSVRAAFNYLSLRHDAFNDFLEDLVQEGLIYLLEKGNQILDDDFLIGENEVEFKEEHIGILYRKCFYNTLTLINKEIEKKGKYNSKITVVDKKVNVNYLEHIEITETINQFAFDELSKEILTYFSSNLYSDESIEELTKILNVDKATIIKYLELIKEQITTEKSVKTLKLTK